MNATTPTDRRPRVLMADDNPHDIELVRLAFEELACDVHLDSARNGDEAVRLLRALVADPALARPRVVLLDLNMPRVGGREVLAYIAGEPALRALPVVMLTTSDSPRDRAACLQLGAWRYIVKAHNLSDFFASLAPVAELVRGATGGPPASPSGGGPVPPTAPGTPPAAPSMARVRAWLERLGQRLGPVACG